MPTPMPTPFRCETHSGRDDARVRPVGELDIATVGRLDERLRELREAGGKRFVLDLRGLTFIDSTGLRLVFELDSFARRDGIELSLVSGPRAVQRVFEVAGIAGLLPFRSP